MESRYTDETPVQCQDCGWQGMVLECAHTYTGMFGTREVEPIDKCPECNSENLIKIDREYAVV